MELRHTIFNSGTAHEYIIENFVDFNYLHMLGLHLRYGDCPYLYTFKASPRITMML